MHTEFVGLGLSVDVCDVVGTTELGIYDSVDGRWLEQLRSQRSRRENLIMFLKPEI